MIRAAEEACEQYFTDEEGDSYLPAHIELRAALNDLPVEVNDATV